MKGFFSFYLNSFKGLPRRAWYLALAQLVNSSGMMVIFFLTIYLTTKRGMSLAQAGLVISAFGIGSMAGTFAGGIFSDRLGTHFIQRWSLVTTGILLILLGLDISYFTLMMVAVFWGFSNGSLFPANSSAMAAECPGELRPRGFVLIRLSNNLGATIGPVVGGILAHYSYSYIFIVDALTCFLSAGMLFIFFPEKGLHVHQQNTANDIIDPNGENKTQTTLLKPGALPAILFSTFMLTTIVGQIFSTWAPYLRGAENFQEAQIGLLLSLSTLMIVFFQMPLIHALESISHTTVALWGGLLYGLGFITLSLAQGIPWQIFSVILWTLGEMLAFPSLMSAVSHLAPPGKQGKFQGFYSLMFSAGLTLGPTAGAWIAATFSWSILWLATAMLGLISAMILGTLKSSSPKRLQGCD